GHLARARAAAAFEDRRGVDRVVEALEDDALVLVGLAGLEVHVAVLELEVDRGRRRVEREAPALREDEEGPARVAAVGDEDAAQAVVAGARLDVDDARADRAEAARLEQAAARGDLGQQRADLAPRGRLAV